MSDKESSRIATWHLKRGSEKKFRSRHPWVFSNELAQSPKGIEPGQLIELHDHSGGFLAIGYGHPHSLIAFRTLTLHPSQIDTAFFVTRFNRAARVRAACGLAEVSHRLLFAEGDDVPGLIVDRFFTARDGRRDSQVFVVQTSTAGMDRLLSVILQALHVFVDGEKAISWQQTAVVIANDSKSRVMEGLSAEPKRVEKAFAGFDPAASDIVIQASQPALPPLTFRVDFVGGQKTGFFLDQRLNIHQATSVMNEVLARAKSEGRAVKVLDLFCYVGQWGTQIAHLAQARGVACEVTLLDASARALELAVQNVERHGGRAVAKKADVLDDLPSLEQGAYDIVICDPPAFVKKKKDLPTGSQAYFKVNREALRRVRPGGVFVSCSCSGLFAEEDFRSMLAKVVATSARPLHWIVRGSHSPDHPQRPEFPQGTYLKAWTALVD